MLRGMTRSQSHLREHYGYDSAGDGWQQPGSAGFVPALDVSGVARYGSFVRVANASGRIDGVDLLIIGYAGPPTFEVQSFSKFFRVPLKDRTAAEILADIVAMLEADPLGFSVAVDNADENRLIVTLEDHILEIRSP